MYRNLGIFFKFLSNSCYWKSKKALDLSIFNFTFWLTSKRKAFSFGGRQGNVGYFQKKFTGFNGRNFQWLWSAAVASAKTSNSHSRYQSRKPYSRLPCTHEKATQTHQTNKPTNQPLQPRNHTLVTRYGNTADIGSPHGRKKNMADMRASSWTQEHPLLHQQQTSMYYVPWTTQLARASS